MGKENLPINDVVEAIAFAAGLGKVITEVIESKTFTPDALSNGIQAAQIAPAAIEGIADVPAQLLDMDDHEREQVEQVIFDLFGDDSESAIASFSEASLLIVQGVMQIIATIRD